MSEQGYANASGCADEVWVLAETRHSGEVAPTACELSAKAGELARTLAASTGRPHGVTVVLIQDARTAHNTHPEALAHYGADRILLTEADALPYDRAACATILAEWARTARPAIILASASAYGRAVMPYAAALLETGLTADCTGLSIEPGTNLLLQTRPAIGGNIMATIKTPTHRPQMATVRPKTFRTPAPDRSRRAQIETRPVPEAATRHGVHASAFEPFRDTSGTMQERAVIVSGGRGLRRAEGFDLLARLAELLGAGLGASRPVVEMKWIGYPHQVGLSGQVVSPKVYIAAGISGTVQHLAGMQTAEVIVSINRDPDAQIFNVSDVAICGDLYEVIPLLIERLEARKGAAQ